MKIIKIINMRWNSKHLANIIIILQYILPPQKIFIIDQLDEPNK